MKPQSVLQSTLQFEGCKPVIFETSDALLTSDAGLLPIRGFDETLGFTRQFADALHDPRDARFTRHSFRQMTRSRIFGTREPQRRFTSFEYQSRSWPHPRRTIVKCEVNAIGTNRRAVVTNRPGASLLPGATYDEYVDRGESDRHRRIALRLRRSQQGTQVWSEDGPPERSS